MSRDTRQMIEILIALSPWIAFAAALVWAELEPLRGMLSARRARSSSVISKATEARADDGSGAPLT